MTVGIEYTRTFPFAERTKAIGEQIRQELDGISSAFTLTDSIVSRAILLPTGVTGTNIPSAVEDRANQVIGFDIAGNLQLQPGVGRYRGAWATGTAYKIRDIFKDTAGTIGLNNLYIVTAPHTSTTLAADSANYTLLISVAEVEAAKEAAQAAQTGAELAESNAASSAAQASASEDAAALSEAAAAADATQTALDRVATGNDATATAADRVQTGLDADSTAADRVQTGLDRVATGNDATATAADRVQTGLDADATAADRVQTGIDASSASASELDAESAAAASISALAEFRGDWLGELAADPSVDGNGDPLDGGEIYFNTTSSVYRVYVSALAQWINLPTYLNATETNPGVVEKATLQETLDGVADKFPDAQSVLLAINSSTPAISHLFEKQTRSAPLFELEGTTLQTAQSLTVNVAGVLLTIAAATSVALPTLASHTDYKVWSDNAGALTAQPWDDADPANSLWIGGFHAYHTDATINEHSLWDLGYRPVCSPRAMAISPDKRTWFDIYLMDTSYGVNGYSRGNAQIADDGSRPIIPAYFGGNGSTTYAGMMWWHAVDLAIAAGKRLPFYGEFIGAAYGVVENSARGTDPVTTGKDTNFRSAIGLEQVTGCMYQWGADIAATAGTAWLDIADGRGDVYASNIKAVLLGANWSHGANAGSRASNWNGSPAVSNGNIGARAVCDHLSL